MTKRLDLFYKFLDDAAEENKEERYKILSIATDWVKDSLDDRDLKPYNVDLLVYVLKYMVKHKKFPGCKTKVKTVKKNEWQGFSETTVRTKFFQEMAENPRAGNVASLYKRYLVNAKAEFKKDHPTVKEQIQIKTFIWRFSSCGDSDDVLHSKYFSEYYEKQFKSWKDVLDFMMKNLKHYYLEFYKEF